MEKNAGICDKLIISLVESANPKSKTEHQNQIYYNPNMFQINVSELLYNCFKSY
jgi:hypothetical protein